MNPQRTTLSAILVGALFLPGSTPAAPDGGGGAAPAVSSASVAGASGIPKPRTSEVHEGPWGNLQSYNVYIEAPDPIMKHFEVPSAEACWTFIGMKPQEALSLLDGPDVPAGIRSAFQEQSNWFAGTDRCRFFPSTDLVVALPSALRARIYAVLSSWPENEFQYSPCFIPGGNVEAWLGDSGLRPDILAAVKKTMYPRGKATCFSDISLLVAMSANYEEARRIIKAITRTPTSILRLRLEKDADLAQIRNYWGGGAANAKDFLPLLQSVAESDDIRHIDLVHILPPLARKLCYTFPHPSQATRGQYPDCHWTSLNFFNYEPEGRMFDSAGAASWIRDHCDRGETPYRYGDILVFVDDQDTALHSCVYLAAGFVYTKNGSNVVSPWLIMKLDEVVERYSVREKPNVRIYRHRS